MKTLIAIAVVVCASLTATAGEPVFYYLNNGEVSTNNPDATVYVLPAVTESVSNFPLSRVVPQAQLPVVRQVVVPSGYHAHETVNGTIIHHDSNFGDPAAHAGVLGKGWPKTAFAGDVVTIGTSADPCPGGVCPVPSRTRAVVN